ncbi:MAG: C10 family peptidase [Saprospiraceae bacterium]
MFKCKLNLFLFFFLTYGITIAKPVPKNIVDKVATNYFNYRWENSGNQSIPHDLKLVHIETSPSDGDVYYIYANTNGKGFIIVAADDASLPILGYSTESTFSPEKQNSSFQNWMNNYKEELIYIKKKSIIANSSTKQLWDAYSSNQIGTNRSVSGVDPLCSAMFDQSPFVNDQTPYDVDEQTRCVTGCPATAMAIIMAKWQHPHQGTGFHSYKHSKYGTVSANFANTSYDWTLIPDTIKEANSEIAKVMFHCGVSVDMQYTASESGAYILIDSPTPMANCEYAYKTYFGYSNNLKGLYREDYTNDEWLTMLKRELDLGHPMQYAGFGAGGHTFVCDGYDDDDYFHMNWGWGGAENGWFALDMLSPGSGGIGSGEGSYNMFQQAIIGIKPIPGSTSSAPKFGISLASDIVLNTNPVIVDSIFNVTVDLKYTGSDEYISDVTALIFNEEGIYIDFVEIAEAFSFSNGSVTSFTFTSTGIGSLPGKYTIGIYGSEPSDSIWHLIRKDNFVNPIDFTLKGDENALLLSSAMTFSVNPVIENTSFTINSTLVNTGESDFIGTVVVDVFDEEGEQILTVFEDNNVNIAKGATIPLSFEVAGLNLIAGSYYLAAFSSEDGVNFPLISNDSFSNPVIFDIVEAPIIADAYEVNNTSLTAYNFTPSFENDVAIISTEGSNFHIPNDIDHYSIQLESGYDYNIKMRLHDQHSQGDQGKYSVDAYYTYDLGQGPSNHIDGSVIKEEKIMDGGNIKLKVSPFFVGFVGNYQLDLEISRMIINSSEDVFKNPIFKLSPNPTADIMKIKLGQDSDVLHDIMIVNNLGVKINNTTFVPTNPGEWKVDLSQVQNGVYYMIVKTETASGSAKFVVIK